MLFGPPGSSEPPLGHSLSQCHFWIWWPWLCHEHENYFLWQFLWSWPWLKKEYEIVIYDVRSVLCSFRKMTIIVKVNALWVDCCLLASDIFMLKYSTDAAPSPVFTLWEWKQDFQWKCCTEVENILWKMYFLICYFSRLLKQRIPTRFYDSSKVTLQSVFPIERHWL